MAYNSATVPQSIEDLHNLSLTIGRAFAQSHKTIPSGGWQCEQTMRLLEMYRESRRMVGNEKETDSRYGSHDAYLATQGY
jgi:hypothetical protein